MQYPISLNKNQWQHIKENNEPKREKKKTSYSTDLEHLNMPDKNELLVAYAS